MIQICPNCRSTFTLIDKVDILAPALQKVFCPVCKQEIWKASGWVLPKRWEVGEVVNKYLGGDTGIPEPQVFEQTIPKEAQAPVWNIKLPDFSGLAKLGEGVTGGIKTGAIIAVVLLALILIFALRR